MQGHHVYQPQLFIYVDIEKLIPKNHILRKLDKIFDLSFVRELTSKFYCHENGRPSIDPELFFRMILVGYIHGIEHDRRLCEEITCNLAYRWYCRLSLEDNVPDHSSLSRIRDRYGEAVFEQFFDEVVEVCRQHGLVKGERIITDSTLIQANASLDSMVARDPIIAQEETKAAYREDITSPLPAKKISNDTHISKTDPDSSMAKKEGTPRGLKYKIHTSIDADSRVILDNKATTGACHDTQVYLDRLAYVESKYQLSINIVIADRAYGSAENIQTLSDRNIKVYIPLFSSRSGQAARVEDNGFKYNKDDEHYVCPEGKVLSPTSPSVGTIQYRSKALDCRDCSAKDSCTLRKRSSSEIRIILRSINQSFYEEHLCNMQKPQFQTALKERMWKIEGINAEAKNQHSLKRAKYRGLSKVQIQASMTAIAQNLKRLIKATFSDILLLIGGILLTIYKTNTKNYLKFNLTFSAIKT